MIPESLHPEPIQWFETAALYDGFETDGRGKQEFGYLAIGPDLKCFAVSNQVLAGPANRFPHYRWVVSYRGSGWVPTIFLAFSNPPAKPDYHSTKHFSDRASTRKYTPLQAVEIINDPGTQLLSTWSSEPDRPASRRLHHYNPTVELL